jgi:small-conductance mechanosensitive channel
MSILDAMYLGNPLWKWVLGLAVAGVCYVVLTIIKRLASRRLAPKVEKTKSIFDDILILLVKKTSRIFILILSLYVGSRFVVLPESTSSLVTSILFIGLCFQVGYWGNELIKFLISGRGKPGELIDPSTASAYGLIAFFARLILYGAILLWLLSNLGVDITALVAGLGIGGIAVALAVQSLLGDVLNSVAIVLDKPFEVGDFVIVGDYMGTVERIGIKTTRVRSLQGEQIVISNTDLINSRIQNFKRMEERRILFSFTVVYQTPAEKLEAIPGMVREIIDSVDRARCDRVHFQSYGDSALIYEVVYYVSTRDYNVYMDIQQAINLAIYRRFEEEGIEFAYPTQTLYVRHEDAAEPNGGEV